MNWEIPRQLRIAWAGRYLSNRTFAVPGGTGITQWFPADFVLGILHFPPDAKPNGWSNYRRNSKIGL